MFHNLSRNVDVRCLNATDSGGEVGAKYPSGVVMTGMKSGAALIGGHVSCQWARGIGVSTVKEGATSFGAAKNPQGEEY